MNKLVLSLSILSVCLHGCTSSSYRSPFEVIDYSQSTQENFDVAAYEKIQTHLEAILDNPEIEKKQAQIIQQWIKAEKLSLENKLDLAAISYEELWSQDYGNLSEYAFNRWLKIQQSYEQSVSVDTLIKKINERGPLAANVLFERMKISSQETLATYLRGKLEASSAVVKTFDDLDQIKLDRRLLNAVEVYCDSKQSQVAAWSEWLASYPILVRRYWQALVAEECHLETKQAALIYEQLIDELSDREYPSLYYESLKRLIGISRFHGEREKMAQAYLKLAELHLNSNLTAKDLELLEEDFILQKINDLLWAARYRALVGDYKRASHYVLNSLSYIEEGFSKLSQSESIKQLKELKLEAHHILAFRIAIENKDYETAISHTQIALEVAVDLEEWNKRLSWYLGWYYYLSQKYERALVQWQGYLERWPGDSNSEKIQFWIAYLNYKNGEKELAIEQFERLCAEQPMSFYSIVAPSLVEENLPWKCAGFNELMITYAKPKQSRFIELTSQWQKKHNQILSKLYRLELALALGLGKKARVLSKDLLSAAYDSAQAEDYLYFSRLAYLWGDVHQSISFAHRANEQAAQVWMRNPDYLDYYFPKDYLDIYQRNASRFYMNTSLLLGVTRRESAFRWDAKSGVGALGLMQLMPPTAERLLVHFPEETGINTWKLLNPEINIKLGTYYLAQLSRRFQNKPESLLAAYNAGEYAVDRWRLTRPLSNRLEWVESIAFSETQAYVKSIMRAKLVYEYLIETKKKLADGF